MKYTITFLFLFSTLQTVFSQFSYISPVPGSSYHYPQTAIILKNGNWIHRESLNDNSIIEINGSKSGLHEWTAKLSDDNKTIIVRPYPVFNYGETVSVTIHSGWKNENGETIEGTTFLFHIRNEITEEERERYRRFDLETFIEEYGYDPSKNYTEEITYPLDSMPTYTINVNNNPAPVAIPQPSVAFMGFGFAFMV